MSTDGCKGRSALGDCAAPVRWAITRQAGPGRTRTLHACGRHVGWLLGYMTVPGQTVEVRRV
jgi:hypothetical protein